MSDGFETPSGLSDIAASSISMQTTYSLPKKPAVSYAALIAQALMDSPDGRLALPEIYAWIQSHYDYYRLASPAWKNSIRHNLSMNRAFCKAEPPPNPPYKCAYWQFAVPTKVKIGSKGKATVSTTSSRSRSKSYSHASRVSKPTPLHPPVARRSSADGVLPIRPRPEWMDRESLEQMGQRAINTCDLNSLLNPTASTSTPSTVILLSSSPSSDGSPPPEQIHLGSVYDFASPGKATWTPPPNDLQDAFHFSRDPLIPMGNVQSPLLR